MPITTRKLEKIEIREHAADLRATRILEVGAFKGQTTAVLSATAAAHRGYVVAIDPMIWSSKPSYFGEWIDGFLHPTNYEKAFWRNVNASGHRNVRLVKSLSTDPVLLASADPQLAEFDLVFIDGDHTHEGVMQDVANWGSRVRPGGRLLLHDVTKRFDGVVRAMKILEKDANVRVTWPSRGMVGVVEILKPIDRFHYLVAVRNGGNHKALRWGLLAGVAMSSALSVSALPAGLAPGDCAPLVTQASAGQGARPAWVGPDMDETVWRLADAAATTSSDADRKCLFAAAEDQARAALTDAPSDVGRRFDLAVVLGLRADRFGGVTKVRAASQLHRELEQILAVAPDHARARHLLGRLHAGVMRMDRVTRWIATNLLGGGALKGGSWAEAERHLAFAEVHAPEVLDHHYELARLYQDTDRPERALEEARHVTGMEPGSAMERLVKERTQQLIEKLSRH